MKTKMLKAWEAIRYCTEVNDDYILNSNPSEKVSNQIIWHNKHVIYDNQSLFYKGWYDSDIIYSGDVFTQDGFRTIEYIKSQVRSKLRKCNAVFDYAKIKQAIPLVWANSVKEEFVQYTRKDNELKVPHLLIGKKVKHVTDMDSKQFYGIIPSKNNLTNTCCLYWEGKLNIDIDWSTVFMRNLVNIKENKLREFNLKLLYNLLPVKSNLFKWGITNDDVCPKCNTKEDIQHAFIECKLNKNLHKYLKELLQNIYQVKLLTINIQHLLKIDCQNNCSLFLTMEFWTIYKLIVERNIT